jgi:predicted nucleic acid-binding protein
VRSSGVGESRFVVNASPLIFLSQIEALNILPRLAREVIVPVSVQAEVGSARKRYPTFIEVEIPEWIRIEPDLPLPEEISGWDLGAGESQVLVHASRLPDCEAVLDDLQARHCARALGISLTGTLGVILRARKLGIIPVARPLLEALIRNRMYLSRELVEGALAEVGE